MFADATALTLQGESPILVGNNGVPDTSHGAPQTLVRGTAIRLDNDRIVANGAD